jgi:hypothetical protein
MENFARVREEQASLLLQREPVRCMQLLRVEPKYANIAVKPSGIRPDLRMNTSRSLMARKGVHKPAPTNLASLIRGLYGRVARQLKVDPSYVSRVARGERQSDVIEASLERELKRIMSLVSGHNGTGRKLAKRSHAKGKKKRVM